MKNQREKNCGPSLHEELIEVAWEFVYKSKNLNLETETLKNQKHKHTQKAHTQIENLRKGENKREEKKEFCCSDFAYPPTLPPNVVPS